ncbi:MAG: hypothetical protein P8I96_02445 [Opitutae bacterium]|nr:hypothetical protein [Opitutae bacterium]
MTKLFDILTVKTAGCALPLLMACNSVFAIDYYFDTTLGNDANTGMTPVEAWRTLSKANTSTFVGQMSFC